MNGLEAGVAGAAVAGIVGCGVYGAMAPWCQWYGPALVAGLDSRQIALTFDDGPNGDTTLRLLDKLAAAEVKATFFLVGRYVLAQPEVARRIVSDGHAVGNHTMTHPRLLKLGPRSTQREIAEAQAAIVDTVGVTPRLFRPPFGWRWPHTMRAARDAGLTTVMWNAMGFDWQLTDPAAIAGKLLRGVERNRGRGVGSNLLMHDGSHKGLGWDRNPTLGAVDLVLRALREETQAPTVEFVTVDAWL